VSVAREKNFFYLNDHSAPQQSDAAQANAAPVFCRSAGAAKYGQKEECRTFQSAPISALKQHQLALDRGRAALSG